MWANIGIIAAGAAGGAVLRWGLGIWLAGVCSRMAVGTLLANWIGAYLIGLLAGFSLHTPALPEHWRLLLITGFLGSLTTFSGFSLEVTAMLQSQRWGDAFITVCLHLFGSIALTFLGMLTLHTLRA